MRHNELGGLVSADNVCAGVGSDLRAETVAATSQGVEVAAEPDRGVITKGNHRER